MKQGMVYPQGQWFSAFNPTQCGRADETKLLCSQVLKVLAFNPTQCGRADETAPAETLVYTS